MMKSIRYSLAAVIGGALGVGATCLTQRALRHRQWQHNKASIIQRWRQQQTNKRS